MSHQFLNDSPLTCSDHLQSMIYTGDENGQLKMWDARGTEEPALCERIFFKGMKSIKVDPTSGDYITCLSDKGGFSIYDVKKSKV